MDTPIVEVEGIVKTFGEVRALAGVDLAFEAGIIYGLLGPNGAGKTTLIRVLATLLRPDAGRARIAGIDVVEDPGGVRERIGLAGQFAAIDAYQTGRENVEMVGRLYGLSSDEARRRANEVLERIHLADAGDRQARTYSGGMRRRLDLAASLVGRPQVLFLDEPTTGIDPRSRQDIWELIDELVADGTTVLLTTQYLEEADHLAGRIAVIDEGRLLTEGTADELKDQLGGSVLELAVGGERRDEALRILGGLDGLQASLDEQQGRISLPAPDGSRTLLAAVRALDAAGIHPDDVALHKPTLDDVFLTLTGAPPTPDAAPPAGATPAGDDRGGRRGRRRARAAAGRGADR